MNKTNIKIELYHDRYKEQLIQFILSIQNDELQVSISRKDQPDLEIIPEIYQRQDGNFWVVLEGNHIIGTVGLIDIGHAQAVLRKMFVAKEYRGRQGGVAMLLLNTVFAWCKEKQFNEIYLGSVAISHAAHRFYEKNGFQEILKQQLPKAFPVMDVDTKFYKFQMHL